MAIYNGGFPVGYQPAYPQAQTYQQVYQQQQQQPVSRLVEVFPVDAEADAEKFPVGMGATGMMFARDDSFIAVKSVGVNGQVSCIFYDKRPPAPPVPAFNPSDYVRRDEVEMLVSAAIMAQQKASEA